MMVLCELKKSHVQVCLLLVFYTIVLCKVLCVLLYNAELAVRHMYFIEWNMQVN